MNMEQLQTVVEKANIIDGDEHFKTMLNFYHDLGMIVKHRSTVILKAQWLIDLFRKLITIPPFDKMVCTSIFFYLRWNLPKIASVVEFALPTGVFFITSPRELIVFLIRILWNQSTGTNSREMVSSAWSLLIACFQNFFVKALSR